MKKKARDLLLGEERTIEIIGKKVDEDKDSVVLRLDGALFDIGKEFIVSEEKIESTADNETWRLLMKPNAKIIQSMQIDYELGQRPIAANLFSKDRARIRAGLRPMTGVEYAGDYDCSFCTDCDCSDCPVDCSRCTDCGECGDCYVASLPSSRVRQVASDFRRRR